jgi:hypothetical protein
MTYHAELHAVVETPWFEGVPPWPWPIADREPFSFVRLSGEMAAAEVGSVMAQVVRYSQIEAEPTAEALLSAVVTDETLILPGGVRASERERVINPGCCCGLEMWREWIEFPESGRGPWTGHDPEPWLELTGGIIRVWSDSGRDGFFVDFELGRFRAELARVESDLRAFLGLVSAWAAGVGFRERAALCRKLDECFGISKPRPTRS